MSTFGAKTITERSIVVTIDGELYQANTSHPMWSKIREAVRLNDADLAKRLFDIRTMVQEFSNGQIKIKDGIVEFGSVKLDNSLTKRMIRMMQEDFDISHLVKFLENLMQNPSATAVNELYGFLEAGEIPITTDGHFLAYKRIRADWTDMHSGQFDNSIGRVVEMPRNQVDDNRDRTCSAGLHFCSYSYLDHFGSWRPDAYKTVVVKINPRDVVSIPKDYNNAKGRCCRYEVIKLLHEEGQVFTKVVEEDKKVGTNEFTRGRVVSVFEACRHFGCNREALMKRCARGISARKLPDGKIEILKE